jgi:hypothetical protein
MVSFIDRCLQASELAERRGDRGEASSADDPSAGLASSDPSSRDYQELIQPIGVIAEDVVQASDLHREVGLFEAKQDDTGVEIALAEDQLAEVKILGNDRSLLSSGCGENLRVPKSSRVLSSDPGDVMSESFEIRDQAGISALVEEEPHAWAV